MPRTKQTAPAPTRNKGQRSLEPDLESYLWRILPQWIRPQWYQSEWWRAFVRKQPFAMDCKDALIDWVCSLDWKIDAKDSEQRDELKEEIDYYTDFLTDTGDYKFTEIVELVCQDYFDIPFGGAVEKGYIGDDPNNRLVWIEHIDGGTLFPTMSKEWPVGQALQENALKTIYFPKHAINRLYMSPRPEIKRKGWGMAPPEKIYFAIEILNRSDFYYANLLLDTPEAGILDLGDMAKDSAENWIKAFQTMLVGIDAFKIPVLYEHESDVKFIPFGKPPTDLMFDRITMKYAALVAASYGISVSEVGLQSVSSGGETLAGAIRQERRSKHSGFGKLKKKLRQFFNDMLPKTLEFNWIDIDDELNVSVGRARLASLTAGGIAIDKKVFAPSEWRRQMIADGLMTISLPEEPPEDEFPEPVMPQPGAKRPGMLGTQVPPSLGGQGEIRSLFEEAVDRSLDKIVNGLEQNADVYEQEDIDISEIINEWSDLVLEKEAQEEYKEQLRTFLNNKFPDTFRSVYSQLIPYVELGDEGIAYINDELGKLRYNLVDEFLEYVISIAKEKNNVTNDKQD